MFILHCVYICLHAGGKLKTEPYDTRTHTNAALLADLAMSLTVRCEQNVRAATSLLAECFPVLAWHTANGKPPGCEA